RAGPIGRGGSAPSNLKRLSPKSLTTQTAFSTRSTDQDCCDAGNLGRITYLPRAARAEVLLFGNATSSVRRSKPSEGETPSTHDNRHRQTQPFSEIARPGM